MGTKPSMVTYNFNISFWEAKAYEMDMRISCIKDMIEENDTLVKENAKSKSFSHKTTQNLRHYKNTRRP